MQFHNNFTTKNYQDLTITQHLISSKQLPLLEQKKKILSQIYEYDVFINTKPSNLSNEENSQESINHQNRKNTVINHDNVEVNKKNIFHTANFKNNTKELQRKSNKIGKKLYVKQVNNKKVNKKIPKKHKRTITSKKNQDLIVTDLHCILRPETLDEVYESKQLQDKRKQVQFQILFNNQESNDTNQLNQSGLLSLQQIKSIHNNNQYSRTKQIIDCYTNNYSEQNRIQVGKVDRIQQKQLTKDGNNESTKDVQLTSPKTSDNNLKSITYNNLIILIQQIQSKIKSKSINSQEIVYLLQHFMIEHADYLLPNEMIINNELSNIIDESDKLMKECQVNFEIDLMLMEQKLNKFYRNISLIRDKRIRQIEQLIKQAQNRRKQIDLIKNWQLKQKQDIINVKKILWLAYKQYKNIAYNNKQYINKQIYINRSISQQLLINNKLKKYQIITKTKLQKKFKNLQNNQHQNLQNQNKYKQYKQLNQQKYRLQYKKFQQINFKQKTQKNSNNNSKQLQLTNVQKDNICQFIFLDLSIELYQQVIKLQYQNKQIICYVRIKNKIKQYIENQNKFTINSNLQYNKNYLIGLIKYILIHNNNILQDKKKKQLYQNEINLQKINLTNQQQIIKIMNNSIAITSNELLKSFRNINFQRNNQFYQEEQQQLIAIPTISLNVFYQYTKIQQLKSSNTQNNNNNYHYLFIQYAQNIYNKSLFDALNQILDHYRLYGILGKPFPWSISPRFQHYSTASTIKAKFIHAIERVAYFSTYSCGLILNDKGNFVYNGQNIPKIYIQSIKEDCMNVMIINQIIQYDHQWQFYDDQYAQVLYIISQLLSFVLFKQITQQFYYLTQRII